MRSEALPPDEFGEALADVRASLGLPPRPDWW